MNSETIGSHVFNCWMIDETSGLQNAVNTATRRTERLYVKGKAVYR